MCCLYTVYIIIRRNFFVRILFHKKLAPQKKFFLANTQHASFSDQLPIKFLIIFVNADYLVKYVKINPPQKCQHIQYYGLSYVAVLCQYSMIACAIESYNHIKHWRNLIAQSMAVNLGELRLNSMFCVINPRRAPPRVTVVVRSVSQSVRRSVCYNYSGSLRGLSASTSTWMESS